MSVSVVSFAIGAGFGHGVAVGAALAFVEGAVEEDVDVAGAMEAVATTGAPRPLPHPTSATTTIDRRWRMMTSREKLLVHRASFGTLPVVVLFLHGCTTP